MLLVGSEIRSRACEREKKKKEDQPVGSSVIGTPEDVTLVADLIRRRLQEGPDELFAVKELRKESRTAGEGERIIEQRLCTSMAIARDFWGSGGMILAENTLLVPGMI